MQERIPVLILAALFGLVTAPHSLVHELVIFVPIFALCAWLSSSRSLLYLTIGIYLGVLFLIPLSYRLGIALLALIPIGFFLAVVIYILRRSSFYRKPAAFDQKV
jgi:hypothetical protein